MGEFTALKQACSTEYHRAQGAFKDSMIHGILQFTLPIAFRCVLHRWENQEIRCRKLCYICWPVTVQRYVSRSYKSIRVCIINRREKESERELYAKHMLLSLPSFLLLRTVHTGLWMYRGCEPPETHLLYVCMAGP